MKNKVTRTIYRILLIASFLAINALILAGISALLSYMNTGADKSSMLHLELPMEKVYAPKITWENLANSGRPMEKQTLQEIERDYLNAWHVSNIAYQKNDRYGIADFYTDNARARVFETIDLNSTNNHSFKSTTLEHHAELNFYSEDGTTFLPMAGGNTRRFGKSGKTGTCRTAHRYNRIRTHECGPYGPLLKIVALRGPEGNALAESDWWWTGLDSNQRTLARADLQSAAFNHSATCPHMGLKYAPRGCQFIKQSVMLRCREAPLWRSCACLSMGGVAQALITDNLSSRFYGKR